MLWSAVRARQWALHFDRLISCPWGQLVGFFLAHKVDSKWRPAVDSNPPARAWPQLAPGPAHSRPRWCPHLECNRGRLRAIKAQDVDSFGNNEDNIILHLGLSRPFHPSFAPALTGRTLNTRRHTRPLLLIITLILPLHMMPVIAL